MIRISSGGGRLAISAGLCGMMRMKPSRHSPHSHDGQYNEGRWTICVVRVDKMSACVWQHDVEDTVR